jgi:hypothetical protein
VLILSLLKPGLIVATSPFPLCSGASERCSTQVGSGLTRKYLTLGERLLIDDCQLASLASSSFHIAAKRERVIAWLKTLRQYLQITIGGDTWGQIHKASYKPLETSYELLMIIIVDGVSYW